MRNQPLEQSTTNILENHLRIVFFGTSDFAASILKSLLNFGYDMAAVVTQPEKPAGRQRIIMPSPVKKTAMEKSILIFEPYNLKNDEKVFKQFKHLEPDLCIVAAYGKIIPPQYLEVPKYGFINIHPSLLPKYRGPSPIQAAIINGDHETGVAIMKVDEELDHGPVLSSKLYRMLSTAYYAQMEQELAKLGAELLIDTLPKYISGEIEPKKQDHNQASFTKLLDREDGRIDWKKPAEKIYNQIRALNPEPGTWTTWKGKLLNIKKAEPSRLEVELPGGTVEKINSSIAVATQKCYLILKQIQLEGGKEMDAKSFLNGHPDFLGSVLE